MDNFSTFFATLSKGRATSTSNASTTSAGDQSLSSSTAANGSFSDALASSSSSSVGGGGGAGAEEASGGPVSGLSVDKPNFTFSTPDQSGPDLPHPQCTPVAFYTSDVPYRTGRLVAASDSYICYAIKDGHIRVINRQSVVRTLLKGHKKPVVDLAFASRTTCTLASLGGDGSFFLWTIQEGPSKDLSKGPLELVPVSLLSVQNINLQRVIWHPTKHNTIAVAQNGEVALLSTDNLIQKSGGKTPPGPTPPSITASTIADLLPDWRFNAHTMTVLDLSFSQDGQYLVTAGADGWARVWDVESRNAVARWQPYGGEPLSRALFLHRNTGAASGEKIFVVTGGKQDSEVKIWKAWKALAPINTQTLTFEDKDNKGSAFHLDADESGELLLLADSLRPLLYVAHVVMGPSNAKIDRLTPFQLKHPVLSLLPMPGVAMDAHEGQADRTGATEVQLYCVQTQAIQIYHIKPEDCLAPSRSPSVSSPPPTLATPASVASKSPTVDNEAAAKKTSTSPAPTPSAEQPAILRMLLQASQAAGSKGESTSPAVPPRTLISPQTLAGSSPTNGLARATEEKNSEEKQAGGARTTEGGAAGEPSASSSKSPASSSPVSAVPKILSRTAGAREGASSGQASRDSGESGAKQAKASPVTSSRTISPAPTVPRSTAATAGGGGGGATGTGAETTILARLEAVEDKLTRVMRERTEAMAERVSASTKLAVTEALGGLGPELQRGISTNVAGKVDKAIKAAVESLPAQLAGGLGEAVKEPVTSSFRQCFQDQLIPAIQTATQRMFAQMSEALNKNLAAKTAGGGGGGPDVAEIKAEVNEMHQQLTSLAGAIGALSTQLSSINDALGVSSGYGPSAFGGRGGRGGSIIEPPSTPNTMSLKEALRIKICTGKFNEAFEQALAASDLDLVTWLCGEAPRDDIFDVDPPLLSQTIMLCLMQQLSFNLGRDSRVKLGWLKQISLAFNPQDPEVAGFVRDVLTQLQSNLEAGAAEVVAIGDQESIKDFKFIQRTVSRFSR